MTTAPKQPTDHLPSKSDLQKAEIAERPEGWETLRPAVTLRSGEIASARADLIDIFKAMGIDLTDENRGETIDIEITSDVLRALGSLGNFLEEFADDKEGFIALDRGPGAQARVTALAMWFMAQLGESTGSAS